MTSYVLFEKKVTIKVSEQVKIMHLQHVYEMQVLNLQLFMDACA